MDDEITKEIDEEITVEHEEQDLSAVLKKLREKLKTCEKDKQEYLLGWQRMRADYVNAKKQAESDRATFATFAEIDLMNDLLPVLSSFDVATMNKAEWEKAPFEWRTGIESIHGLFVSTLKNRGLEIIDPAIGTDFDPSIHEAIETETTGDKSKDSKVLKVVERGYSLQGKSLKAPRVIIGEYLENKN